MLFFHNSTPHLNTSALDRAALYSSAVLFPNFSCIYASMLSAICLAAATAATTVLAPVTTSPDANTPSIVDIGVVQIVDRIEDMAEGLSGHAELARLPGTGSKEHAAIAVIKQILYTGGSAQLEIGTEHDAHVAHSAIVAVQDRLGKTEFRNTVAENTADLLSSLEYSYFIAAAGQDDRDRDTRRASADNTDLHAVRRGVAQVQSLKTGIRNIVLYRRKVNGLSLNTAHTVPFALALVIADQRTYNRQRVILKEDLCRLHHLVFLKQADDFRNIRLNRASLHTAAGILALQAAIRFINYMYGHNRPPKPTGSKVIK